MSPSDFLQSIASSEMIVGPEADAAQTVTPKHERSDCRHGLAWPSMPRRALHLAIGLQP